MRDGMSSPDPDGANSLQAATSIAVAEIQLLARQTADELLALAASLHTTRSGAFLVTQHRAPSIGMPRGEIGDERA